MEDEECGRGKRVKRVIVCRNGWHNCCLPAFEKIGPCGTISRTSFSPCRGDSCKVVSIDSLLYAPKASLKAPNGVPKVKESKPSRQLVTGQEKVKGRENVRLTKKVTSKLGRLKKDKYDNTLCEECARGDGEQEMLLCDRCDRGYHMYCLSPILPTVPLDDWFCPKCSQSSHVQEFPKVQKKIVDFFRIQKPSPFTAELKCVETRKRRRPSGGSLCLQKKSRRLLPYVPCAEPQRRLEQMASLATALTSIGVEFTDSLSYGLAPRSANRAENEKGGMQVMSKEDKATLDLCKKMCSHGEWPPLMVTHDSRQGFVVEADGNIKDLTIIAEYTGEVDYMRCREHDSGNSIMGLLFSDDPAKELVICPDRCGNIARFVSGINNHSPEGRKKQNVRCVRYNIDGEARAILVAIRDIPKGERLYYDYNAYQTEYPTKHFV
ncbi:histone-lysine N-methyltransferase ATXR6 [Physcomitrium patens]|uniref:Uncharacterized protein n=1 Tax=Physcomitrium patens TaxID=3218 RepID=A0A2K1IGR5_PHYPA|nr:histone-lysine N-methyltransferase ATXR6-like [Physcomitrium patens]PNR28469.1 hypothetical protein PHYPA_029061 [Physcomitrium patens]|eukprot:XP_024364099.1 histone-lysine N-methyltransferase ATXR6-like [Physcomitrella patens]